MGIWGCGLYQNDTSLNVKDTFLELYNDGKTVKEITDKLTEDYETIMGNIEEEPLFWYALAEIQWELGVLLPIVKEKVLYWIDRDCGTLQCQKIGITSIAQRKKVLDNLKAKLLSPYPQIKKPVKKQGYVCPWRLGDVFAYRLESDLSKEKGLYGRYFLIQKIDEDIWYPSHIVPIVYIKITDDTGLPSNVEEYNQLKYVQTWFTKYEERFWPIDMRRPQEDIDQKSKINYEVDEYGFLPQYRETLISTSKRVIPKKLIYVGNFENSIRPQKEFIPHAKVNIDTVSWKDFEVKMIKRYCDHNLRELCIYSNCNN